MIIAQIRECIIIWLSLYVLSVHSLSPPKPAGLDPLIFRRRTLYYMRKSLGIKVFCFLEKKIWKLILKLIFWIFFWIFFWNLYFKKNLGNCFLIFSVKTRSVAEQPASND
jgi:hypothetical protein